EIALSKRERFYVPQQSLYQIEPELRPGDIVAATSSVEGLDVAHTGLAIRKDDRIHLLHAPLVGGVVQISEQPLTERILDKMAQDGVIVARPLG
ncbi:MAG: N-acetylmuramoyl-L-alanine amidase-like domain-containing protein, partial [Longimicrobiales bacterium]